MLTVRCELLLGSYQAADPFGPADAVEWPPHPYRLHAALVGAACEAGGDRPDSVAVDALRWLEEQAAPTIACSAEPSRRGIGTSWVPRNPTRGAEWARYVKAGTAVNRVGRTFPTAVPASPVLSFTWPDPDAPPEALRPLVEAITWLGSSRSPVACAILADSPEPTFVPDAQGVRQIRVAAPGITNALLDSRFTHPQPISAPIAGYEPQKAADAGIARTVAGPFSDLLVRRVLGATQDVADTPVLGAALRAAVLSRAGDTAPPALHGHETGRGHAAYLTLVDVGHTAARGTVRGVALALPSDIEADERIACLDAFRAIDPLVLPDGRRPLVVDDDVTDLWTLAAEHWVGPATDWATVTPIVLDRFPRRGRTPHDELLASIKHAGFPQPEAVELLAGPPLAGSPVAGGLRGEVPPGMRIHARLHFPVSVRGPIVIGRGRFRGVGCLIPEHRP